MSKKILIYLTESQFFKMEQLKTVISSEFPFIKSRTDLIVFLMDFWEKNNIERKK